MDSYQQFLEAKVLHTPDTGFTIDESEINPMLKPHQKAIVKWAVRRGRAAIFAAFGLGKTVMQLETLRIICAKIKGRGLIVCPLGVRFEFVHDAEMLGIPITFVRSIEECGPEGLYITNYETVREGKLDPRQFSAVSLDEAACLRGLGGTKTFRKLMGYFEGSGKYRIVATATPSPNDFIELLAYSAFLDVMDVSAAKTRFFKRDSEHADQLRLMPHKEVEFWLWCSSWAVFLQSPADLGFSDVGYALPPMKVRWHEIPSDHSDAGQEPNGQGRLIRNSAIGVTHAAKEKRSSLSRRIETIRALVEKTDTTLYGFDQFVVWCDLNDEQNAIDRLLKDMGITYSSLYGADGIETREQWMAQWRAKQTVAFVTKPSIYGAGCNLQQARHAIFPGVGYKFYAFIQAIHRVYRFLQEREVIIDIIYTEAEREIRKALEDKWEKHKELIANMTEIIRKYGLGSNALAETTGRTMNLFRQEQSGESWKIVNNDCIPETRSMPENSVDLIVTSIPFSTQYEYSPSFRDFGHTENNAHFWQQMDFLIPQLFRVLQPGRVAAIHVKDRITPSGLTGMGFQTVQPFSDECTAAFIKHGFGFLARKTIVTDVVRENNQTYRLGWTEQCKDGSRMGAGMPEYLLLFRKPPTDTSNGYADTPVVKDKKEYTRSRWQIDAHGFMRSNGNRAIIPSDLEGIPHDRIFKLFRQDSMRQVYDFERHVGLSESLERCQECGHVHTGDRKCGQCPCKIAGSRLPATFMLLQPQSWHDDVWTDIARMRTLNMNQAAKGRELHICLARGALVLTNTGHKPIQDVRVGDLVLTHKGRWMPVTVVRNMGVRRVVVVHAQGVSRMVLTPEHEMWARPVRSLAWSQNHSKKEADRTEPRWVRADHTEGSYINRKLPPVDDTPHLATQQEWKIVGRWLADGHWEARGSAMISCDYKEIDEVRQMLGIHCGGINDTGTSFQVRIKGASTVLEILRQCGVGAEGKHVPMAAFVIAPEHAKSLLDGYLSGDGHYLPDRNRWCASSVSRELLLGMAFIAQRAYGAIASIYPGRPARTGSICGRTVNMKADWIFSFDIPDSGRKKGLPFVREDGAWMKVRQVSDAGESETWCLRVEEDESFTADGCIVKNCPLQFDIVDRVIAQFSMKGETVFDPFAGLATVPMRAVMLGRKGLGVELSEDYYADGLIYMKHAEAQRNTPTLFDLIDGEAIDHAADSSPLQS